MSNDWIYADLNCRTSGQLPVTLPLHWRRPLFLRRQLFCRQRNKTKTRMPGHVEKKYHYQGVCLKYVFKLFFLQSGGITILPQKDGQCRKTPQSCVSGFSLINFLFWLILLYPCNIISHFRTNLMFLRQPNALVIQSFSVSRSVDPSQIVHPSQISKQSK